MQLSLEQAIRHVKSRFPFEDYLPELDDRLETVGQTVLRYLPRGASVLDFGCGPCDRTAVLQALGYKCSAADDLQDDWHRIDGNRDKILAFAKGEGIDFRLIEGETIPFDGANFDMVMLHDVLEHLHNSPRDLLNSLLGLVKPAGLLFVTVPNAVNIRKRIDVLRGRTNLPNFEGYFWYPGQWRGHIREYTRGDLVQLSEFLSLQTLELGNRHHMLERLNPALRPAYRLVTRVFPNFSDSLLLVAKKPPGWKPRTALSAAEVENLLERIPNCPIRVCN